MSILNYNTQLQSNNVDLQAILNAINNLPEASTGVELPKLTNPASASDILVSKEAINANGMKITGSMLNNGTITSTMDGIDVKSVTIPEGYTSGGTVSLDNTIDNEVDTQADLIAQINSVLEGKAAVSGEDVTDETAAYTQKLEELETAIAALEAELEGKTGDGSSIEIYSGTISITPPTHFDLSEFKLFVTDKNLESQTIIPSGMQYNLDVAKNTIVAISGGIPNSLRGCVLLGGGYGDYAVLITENNFFIGF